MDVTIVVATYGDTWWWDLGQQRAVPSARAQGVPVVAVHDPHTLHGARNAGLREVNRERVVFLDADDELEPGYIAALHAGTADVRAPAVRYMRGGHGTPPRVPQVAGHRHSCVAECLTQGNWLVVGSMAPTQLLHDVGGWRDFAWSEDWDLWLRCHLKGASFQAIPQAVYRAHVRPGSRNRRLRNEDRVAVHRAIETANGLGPGGVPCR